MSKPKPSTDRDRLLALLPKLDQRKSYAFGELGIWRAGELLRGLRKAKRSKRK